jgi:hypothetical protein
LIKGANAASVIAKPCTVAQGDRTHPNSKILPRKSCPIAGAIGASEQMFGVFEQMFGANQQIPDAGQSD